MLYTLLWGDSGAAVAVVNGRTPVSHINLCNTKTYTILKTP
jgi:hypothetical protein